MGDVGSDFHCPNCSNASSKVVDSRPIPHRDGRRRRRECLACGVRFDTYEVHTHELGTSEAGQAVTTDMLLPIINTIGVSARRMKDLIRKQQQGGQR